MKKTEHGRSMIEMLGVLAVMGVLSVGGIVGYSIAMNRYQANQIVDASSKYSLYILELCKTIYNNKQSGLLAVKYCSPATPGIQTFQNSKVASLPHAIYNQGISFAKIKEVAGSTYEVYIEHKLSSKDVCQALKSITNQKSGCIEQEAPFILTIPFKQN